MSEKKSWTWTHISVIVALVINIAAWVWSASAMYSQVLENEEAVVQNARAIRTHDVMISDHEARLRVKDSQNKDMGRRLERIEEKLDRLLEAQGK